MNFRWVLLLFIAFLANHAYAEGGCPAGQFPIGGQGIASCAPLPPGYYQKQAPAAPQPLGKWIKTWGAVAQDAVGGNLGVSVGRKSEREARDEARAKCIEVGGTQCKDWVSYENQCVAIAGPQKNGVNVPGKLQFAQGPSLDDIQRNAAAGCASANGSQCGVLYSACSEPIFQRY